MLLHPVHFNNDIINLNIGLQTRMKIIDLHIHLANSNTQSCLHDCECDFTSSDKISLRLRAKGIMISCITRYPRLRLLSKIKNYNKLLYVLLLKYLLLKCIRKPSKHFCC